MVDLENMYTHFFRTNLVNHELNTNSANPSLIFKTLYDLAHAFNLIERSVDMRGRHITPKVHLLIKLKLHDPHGCVDNASIAKLYTCIPLNL